MAALGKIRSRGVALMIVIGVALFAFIAEEAFRSCSGLKGEARQQIGEILGKKVSVQEYQKLLDEYQDAIKFTTQRDNISEAELNQIKDQVWQQLVSNRVIENEGEKIGLTVTEQEIQNILNEGTNPVLAQTPFVNQQTGRFDVNILKQFIDNYKKAATENPQQAEQMKPIYNYWLFVEKNLRSQLLGQKLQGLLSSCVLSNKAEAKLAFTDENQESQIQLAAFPYSSVKDSEIKITDNDIKAKYEELKPMFRQVVESRDIKYVDFQIKASKTDRNEIQKEMSAYQKQLATVSDPSSLISKSGSIIPYLGIPVSSAAYQAYPDIASKIDSLSVGTTAVTENKADNTLNIVRVFNKQQLPDSIQFRQIQVAATTPAQAKVKADSIQKALASGADFEKIAKRYGQTGEKTWLTGAQYESATSMNKDNRTYLTAILNGKVNAIQNLSLTQGSVVIQVLDKKAIKTKTIAAIIKKTIDFSKETRSSAYNKFAEYVAKGVDLASLEKYANKFGYRVQEQKNVSTSQHDVAGVRGTKDALKWIFEAKEGEISPLYECGDNDHFMVLCLTNIHPKGYRPLDDPEVKEKVRAEVLKDKKAELLMARLKGVKSIAAAKAKGAKIMPISQITFASPAFIPAIGMVEPAISGAVASTSVGKMVSHPVKGQGGVYLFQVISKKMRPGVKFNELAQMQQCILKNSQIIGNFMQDLVMKANIVDNRYLYF